MALSEMFYGRVAVDDAVLNDDLDQLMRWVRRDGGKTVSARRFASYIRLGAATVAASLAAILGLSPGWGLVVAVIGVGLAIVQTVNDWEARNHLLLLYLGDQALHLHQEQKGSRERDARQLARRLDRVLRDGRRRRRGGLDTDRLEA